MCLIREAIHHSISRRKFLKAAGSLAAAPFLAGLGGSALAASSPSVITRAGASKYNTHVVLLGTAGGPSWWPNCDRVSASTAVVVGDDIYLIDLGHGSTHRLAQAFNSGIFVNTGSGRVENGYPTYLRNVKALFLTHLHQDHTADYPTILTVGYGAGFGVDPKNPKSLRPVKVFGPGERGQLEDFVLKDVPGSVYPNIIYTDSGNSNPGTREMTKYLWQAFAQTINNFTLDDGWPDFRSLVDLYDIGWTSGSDIMIPFPSGTYDPNDPCTVFKDPNATPCPPIPAFPIYPNANDANAVDENGVKVKATLVNHHQVFPSFAFRFDTPDGSVVISGDTGPNTCDNLQNLAQGADVLIHEVIDEAWIDLTFGDAQQGTRAYALKTHLQNSHTTIDLVGQVAEKAGVKALVLNHIVPGNTPISHLRQAKKNFYGELIIGTDLMQIGIGKARRRKG